MRFRQLKATSSNSPSVRPTERLELPNASRSKTASLDKKLAIARSIIQRKHTPAPVVETSLLSLWHLRRSLAQTRYTPAMLEALTVKAARRLTRLRLWRRHVRCGAAWLRFSHILLDSWAHVAFLSQCQPNLRAILMTHCSTECRSPEGWAV